jgi:hypothetical protein
LKKQAKTTEPALFKPAETVRMSIGGYRRTVVNGGESLEPGVIVNYYLPEKPAKDQKVTLTFIDSEGKEIHTYVQKPKNPREDKVTAKKGMNRFVWDLRYPPSRSVKGAVFWGPGSVSPVAIPGDFKVRLKMGEKSLEQSFTLTGDPNLKTTQDEYRQQFEFLVKVRDKLSETHDIINEIHGIRDQVKWVVDRTKDEKYHDKLKKSADDLEKKTGSGGRCFDSTPGKSFAGPVELSHQAEQQAGSSWRMGGRQPMGRAHQTGAKRFRQSRPAA